MWSLKSNTIAEELAEYSINVWNLSIIKNAIIHKLQFFETCSFDGILLLTLIKKNDYVSVCRINLPFTLYQEMEDVGC